jgi:hypothetical protein
MPVAAATSPRQTERAVAAPTADLLFVLAPFWIGFLYLAAIYILPSWRPFIFFIFLAVLGETHFGATGLFLLVRDNRTWLWQRRTLLLYTPLGLVIAYIGLGVWNLPLAMLIGSVASGFHVTRQSIGISRLYGGTRRGINELLIYGASLGFLGIGFARFYAPGLPFPPAILTLIQTLTPIVSVALLGGLAVYLLVTGAQSGFDRRWLAVLTGCALYCPYCFVVAPQDAVAVGVGMHWCQYLTLNAVVYRRQAIATGTERRVTTAVILVGIYGIVMASILTAFGSTPASTSLLVLLPLSGEIIHYYIDAFIWRFSDPQIRKTVGAYVWSR